MDRVGTGCASRVDDAVDPKVAVAGRVGPDAYRLVRHADVTRGTIALGIDRHRFEVQVAARANHAHRDLPAVGDEDFVQNQAILAFDVPPTARTSSATTTGGRSQSGMFPCFLGG